MIHWRGSRNCRVGAAATLLAAGLAMLGGCGSGEPATTPEPAQPSLPEALIERNNEGVGLMGRFDYAGAERVFAEVVERAPDWTNARINLAIATLNRQQAGDEEAALAMLEAIVSQAPDQPRARYLAGLLRFNQGQTADALVHFRAVAEADPADAYARYYTGQALLQQGDPATALKWFEEAAELDPYLRSAHYGAFLAHQRLGQAERARGYLEQYRKLEANPRSRLVEIKYTRMGPKAEALAVRTGPANTAVAPEPPPGALFAEPVILDTGLSSALGAVPLIEGERRGLLHAGISGSRWCRLDGDCSEAGAPPFAGQVRVLTAAWGDIDNDGRTDLYLGRSGVNQLWRQREDGGWEDVTEATGTGGSGKTTVGTLLLDADHDGDLDIFLVDFDGPNELLNNNGDGTFRPLAAEQGLTGSGNARQALAADLDGDRDTDLVVVNREPPHEVYLNDRLWAYRPGTGFEAFTGAALVAAAAVDADADGQVELYGLDHFGHVGRWRPAPSGWRGETLLTTGLTRPLGLWPADLDGDGAHELLLSGTEGWQVVELAVGGAVLAEGPGRALGFANLSPAEGPSLLSTTGDDLKVHPPGPGRHRFLALGFSGREDPAQSMRSNASGIGTEYVMRAGSLWFAGSTLPQTSMPGQPRQLQLVGLGGRERIDYLALEWSDGVFQTELQLEAGREHALVETQRQLASCPVLFAWDGERFAFVSDVLGVAGIGFNTGFGEYTNPRPWENFLLPQGLPAPRDGVLALKIAEPMEEIAYLDRVRLVAYDHPDHLELALDERLAVNGPAPSGQPVMFRRVVKPELARDHRGRDVTAELAAADSRAAPLPPLDGRFVGLLAQDQTLTLAFGNDLSALSAPALLMDGWVEYGYSQTNFAAWQAGLRYRSVSLDARVGDDWVPVSPEFGYPAGMPRTALLELPPLPPGTRALRLDSNQQIYFDRLALVERLAEAPLKRRVAPLRAARVERIGFPRRRNGPQMQPDYDYDQRTPFWDVRYPAGFYTALGPATELIEALDNALAIIGPGDALSLEFEAPPPPPAGWRRRWVLELEGWAKDMDLYTRDGDTVAPLPTRPVAEDRAAALHPRFNTRYQSGT